MSIKKFVVLIFLVALLTACGGLPDVGQIQEQVSEAAQQGAAVATQAAEFAAEQGAPAATQAAEFLAEQGAALATEAAELAAEGGDVALTRAAEVAATTAAQIGAEGQDAVATLAAAELDGTTFAEKFSQIQLDGGTEEIAITEAEMSAAIARAQEAAAAAGQPQRVQNPVIRFTDGSVILNANVVNPSLGEMEVVFQPYIGNDGTLQFTVVGATVAGVTVPPVVLQSVEGILNVTLSTGLNRLPAGVGLQSVFVGEGVMTLVVGTL